MPRKFKRPIQYHFGKPISGVEAEQVVEDTGFLIGVSAEFLKSHDRSGSAIKSRRIASWVIRGVLRLSFAEVGFLLNKHHTTVLHAHQCWEVDIDSDPSVRADTARLLWAVWRAHRSRMAGKDARAKTASLRTLQYKAGKRSSQQRLVRKQKEQERTFPSLHEVSWSEKDWAGTPTSFFKKQNDRFVAHARLALAQEQKERAGK